PKGETQLSPEEKLLRAIFGEKAGDVRDTSLRVPPGVGGIVIGAKIFSRKGVDKDERSQQIEDEEEQRLLKDQNDEIKIIRESLRRRIEKLTNKKSSAAKITGEDGKTFVKKGDELTPDVVREIPDVLLGDISVGDDKQDEKIQKLVHSTRQQIELVTT